MSVLNAVRNKLIHIARALIKNKASFGYVMEIDVTVTIYNFTIYIILQPETGASALPSADDL